MHPDTFQHNRCITNMSDWESFTNTSAGKLNWYVPNKLQRDFFPLTSMKWRAFGGGSLSPSPADRLMDVPAHASERNWCDVQVTTSYVVNWLDVHREPLFYCWLHRADISSAIWFTAWFNKDKSVSHSRVRVRWRTGALWLRSVCIHKGLCCKQLV